RIEAQWAESTVTWQNQPPATSIGKSNGVGVAAQYVGWDIQALVQSWVANPGANWGIELRSALEGTGPGWRLFRSRENETAPPQLVIEYHVPAPTSTATSTPTPTATPTQTSTPTTTPTAPPIQDPQVTALHRLETESLRQPHIVFEAGKPRFVAMRVPSPASQSPDPVARALDFLERYRHLYRLYNPRAELYLERIVTDASGQHLFFGQQAQGWPVFGAQLAVHLTGDAITSTNGDYLPELDEISLDAVAISPRQAETIALAATPDASNTTNGSTVISDTKLMLFDAGLLGATESKTRLVWRVLVCGGPNAGGVWLIFVDAHDGAVLHRLNQTPSHAADKDFDIETANHTNSGGCWNALFETADDEWFDEDGPTGDGDGFGLRPAPAQVECDPNDANFNDCGFVHTNSGIVNKAAYLIAWGGHHGGLDVRGIGRPKTQRLY
ncbi:MAG TPA: DNRLRE domain-containing protein, partial [Anaerolineales bacterium]